MAVGGNRLYIAQTIVFGKQTYKTLSVKLRNAATIRACQNVALRIADKGCNVIGW